MISLKKQRLRKEVNGVIAVATDGDVAGDHVFGLHESAEIASFIEKRFLHDAKKGTELATLLVNSTKIPLETVAQETLTGAVTDFVKSLKFSEDVQEIELRIRLSAKK